MNANLFPVSIDGVVFPPEHQVETNFAWKQRLAYGHRKDLTYCLCDRKRPVPLVIRHYSSTKGPAHYGLARWKGTHWDHHPDCRFFLETFDDGRSSDPSAAFQEMEDGRIRVHLSRSLGVVSENSSVKPLHALAEDKRGRRLSSRKASDSTLLNRVWRTANLNLYRERECTWFTGSLRFLHAANRYVLRRTGETLADYLLLGASAQSRNAQTHNAAVLQRAGQHPTRLYLLARLRAPTQAQAAKRSFLLPLRDYEGLPKVLIERDLLDRFLSSRQFANASLSDPSTNVVAFFSIEPGHKDWWHCVDLAGFVASSSLIPLESHYELEMERYLVAENRTFVKPMHGEENDAGSGRRPDFLLLDTKPRTAIEVWGMTTPDYLASKGSRLSWYRENNVPLVSWNAADGEALPTLPARTPANG
jgi:hypothetical protein